MADSSDDVTPEVPATLGELLHAAVSRHPDRLALIFADEEGRTDRRMTYAQLLAAAERGARRLLRDLSPGKRVAVWSGNRPEWIVAEFATALAGLVLVAVNPAYAEPEARYVLSDSGAAALLVDSHHRGDSRRAVVERLADELPAMRHVYDIEDEQGWLDAEQDGPPLPEVGARDLAQILYTSGTTGRPKGVPLHHRGLTLTPPAAARLFELGDEARWLNAMPMFHVGGCGLPTIGSVAIGATQILCERYRPSVVRDLIGRERVSFFGGVPAMIYDLLHSYDPVTHDWSSLQLLLSGAATVSPAMVMEVERTLGVRFILAYGQTEAHGHVAQTVPGDSADDKAYTIGRPLPHIEVRIVDPESGSDLPTGEQGELWCRSASTTPGYLNQPEATARLLAGDGWMRTGDACWQDARGYLTFVGRLGEIINRGGEKFAPREVEEALASHPSVAAAAVAGVPDDRLGHRVAAFIRPAGQSIDEQALRDHLGPLLAAYKIPEHWVVVDQLPMTSSGKVSRQGLLELWGQQPADRIS